MDAADSPSGPTAPLSKSTIHGGVAQVHATPEAAAVQSSTVTGGVVAAAAAASMCVRVSVGAAVALPDQTRVEATSVLTMKW